MTKIRIQTTFRKKKSEMLLKLLFSITIAFIATASFGADVEVHLVTLQSPSSSGTTEVPLSFIGSLLVGQDQDYYIEVWTSDVGSVDISLTMVYVHERHAPYEVAYIQSIDHDGSFTTFPSRVFFLYGISCENVLVGHKIPLQVSTVAFVLWKQLSSKIINFVRTNQILFEETV